MSEWNCKGLAYSEERVLAMRSMIEENSIAIPETGCWIWEGSWLSVHNYGRFKRKGKATKAHRASYAAFVGPIPDDMIVCHKCDTPPCVNPDHLFLGTHLDNQRDKKAKGRLNAVAPPPRLGSKHHKAKLTEADVLLIREEVGLVKDIAEKYGVSAPMISYIRNRKNWRHI